MLSHVVLSYLFLLILTTTTSKLRQHEITSNLVGGFNPSEKYESQLGLLFPIYGK
jgi:hypothetical protein